MSNRARLSIYASMNPVDQITADSKFLRQYRRDRFFENI